MWSNLRMFFLLAPSSQKMCQITILSPIHLNECLAHFLGLEIISEIKPPLKVKKICHFINPYSPKIKSAYAIYEWFLRNV